MRRLKLELSYDGTNYRGWQRQPDVPTIQETLETVLTRITGEKISVTGSGRTDAGVHALKQVAAFTTTSHLEAAVFRRALNGFLPTDIRILHAEDVPLSFHPIADAVSKRYRYLIDDNRPHCPFSRHFAWHYREPLDRETMQAALPALLGTHDFACFQTQGSPRKSTVRTINDATLKPLEFCGTTLMAIEVEANGFLYNMMRAIVGTLVLLGVEGRRLKREGKNRDNDRMRQIIASCERSQAGPTAPPQGLFLVDVMYKNSCRDIEVRNVSSGHPIV